MTQTQSSSDFSSLRSWLWPIYRHELVKLLPMVIIFFLLSFSYNTLRTLKDVIVVSASGAKVIPFIKMWVMFPGSVAMAYLFTRLSNRLNRETVFYIIMSLFLGFFAFYTFVVYPNVEQYHLHALADWLIIHLPPGFHGVIDMIRYWSFSIFYSMCELWGNIVLFLLFWGFANEVTPIQQAKRFYGILGVGANSSGILAGLLSVNVLNFAYNPYLPFGKDAWEQQLSILVLLILGSGLISMVLYRWLNVKVLSNPIHCKPETVEHRAVRAGMSMRENFAYLFRSNYLIHLSIIVIAYNVIINLVEVLWKDQVSMLYPDKSDYGIYMNYVTMIIGVIATVASLLFSTNLIRKFGWTSTALITPVILFFTSIAFFGFYFFGIQLSDITLTLLGVSPLSLVVLFGTLQNCMSRAAKYTVYDATKEIAFIPLPTDLKLKGKAAIDGVCNRLGKSGGSVIHQLLLFYFVELSRSAPYVALCLFIILAIWFRSVIVMGKEFNELSDEKKEPSFDVARSLAS